MVSPRDVRDLLEERPDLEAGLEAVLEPEEPWTFEDLDLDSGRFGELVARGFVEEIDGEYRVADREIIEQALQEDVESAPTDRSLSLESIPRFNLLKNVSRREIGLLAGALFLVFLFRTVFSYQRVFQAEHVVLSGNDPYSYRYWIELLLTDPNTTLSTLPNIVLHGEPLMVATLWFVTSILGGTPHMAGLVLAWYPVVSALITAVLVYAIAVFIMQDRRIGLASVAMLAVLPGHALRTSLGFADHHAFDYPWLVLTLLGVVLITVAARKRTSIDALTCWGIIAVAIGVSGQVLAWEAGPLLIAPLGLWFAIDAIRAVHLDESPIRSAGPVLIGVGLAAIATWSIHGAVDWHSTLVASAPLLLATSALGVVVAAQIAHRLDVPALALGAAEIVGLAGALYALATVRPEYWSRLTSSVEGRLFARHNIAEMQGLFADSGGWILLFGLLLFLGLPYLTWATQRSRKHEHWLPVVIYGWAFFGLSVIQVRFVGEFSPIIAIFCGLGFVHLAAWIEVAEHPAPFTDATHPGLTIPRGHQLRVLVVLFLLVTSLSIIQVPVKTGHVTTPQDQFEAAAWMMGHEADLNRSYPANYVFSNWGDNRMYNYFVNGESASYNYALHHWSKFVTGQNGSVWYQRLKDRAGYVVLDQRDETNTAAIGTRLYLYYGSRSEKAPGLAHYRARFVAGDYKVFTLTPGAVIKGTTDPGTTIEVSTTVTIPGAKFQYVRRTTANSSGAYSIRVPYPGTYDVAGTSVTVTERDLNNATTVTA